MVVGVASTATVFAIALPMFSQLASRFQMTC